MPKIEVDGVLKNLLKDCESNPEYEFDILEEGEWISEGKYEYKDIIFEYKGKTYRWYKSRSGSYFSDWEYEYDDYATEVEPVEVTTIHYKAVK